jgi:hypothetical protein
MENTPHFYTYCMPLSCVIQHNECSPQLAAGSIHSTASEMVDVTAYRHRVTLEALLHDQFFGLQD